MNNNKLAAFSIPEETHRQFKAACAIEGTKMSFVITQLMRLYITKAETKRTENTSQRRQ